MHAQTRWLWRCNLACGLLYRTRSLSLKESLLGRQETGKHCLQKGKVDRRRRRLDKIVRGDGARGKVRIDGALKTTRVQLGSRERRYEVVSEKQADCDEIIDCPLFVITSNAQVVIRLVKYEAKSELLYNNPLARP